VSSPLLLILHDYLNLFKLLIMPKYCRILTLHFILLPFALNALADSFTTAFSIQRLPSLVNHSLDIDFLEVILNFLEIFFLHSNYSKIGRAVIFDIWSSWRDLNAVTLSGLKMWLTVFLVIFGKI
jgi:hypothetical protein